MTDRDTDEAAELAPCPFCGGTAEVNNYVVEAAVRCTNCGASVVKKHGTYDDSGLPEAIAAWNRRARPSVEAPPVPSEGAETVARYGNAMAAAEQAMRYITPYLVYTIGDESPGHHPTMPSAVGAFKEAHAALRAALQGEKL